MTNAERLKRLRMLRAMLKHYKTIFGKRTTFNMRLWLVRGEGRNASISACVGGLACTYEPFNKMGLKLSDRYVGIPVYREHRNWRAIEEFFGLTERGGERIFYKPSYGDFWGLDVRPSQVIARITETIKRYEKKAVAKAPVKKTIKRKVPKR